MSGRLCGALAARRLGVCILMHTIAPSLARADEVAFTTRPEPRPEPPPPPRTRARPPSERALQEAAPARATPSRDWPLAGHQGLFFVRDRADLLRLYPMAHAMIDGVAYAGPGVEKVGLGPSLFLRRVRLAAAGEIAGLFYFMVQGDFGATGNEQSTGQNARLDAAAPLGPASERAATAQDRRAGFTAQPSDVFFGYRHSEQMHLQLGQFDAPFTRENRTLDRFTPLPERAMTARVLGAPRNKDIGLMAFGDVLGGAVHYEAGFFNGDGPNRVNPDGQFDVMGRVLVAPLSARPGPLAGLEVGASGRYGMRGKDAVFYDLVPMTTAGHYAFFAPYYEGARGPVRIAPANGQLGAALELFVPVSIIDVVGELVWVRDGTKETPQLGDASYVERLGRLTGVAYQAQLGWWVWGSRRALPRRGVQPIAHVNLARPPATSLPQAVEVVLRFEQLRVSYESARVAGVPDTASVDGDIRVTALTTGVSYWAGQHVRLSASWGVNLFDGAGPRTPSRVGRDVQTSAQRAMAPGNRLAPRVDDQARDHAAVLHEVMLRAGVGF